MGTRRVAGNHEGQGEGRMKGHAIEVLSILQRRKSRGITAMDALAEIGCMRLAARIYDLRMAGHDIETRIEEYGTSRIARYVLRGLE